MSKYKLKPSVKKIWLAALRRPLKDDGYRQGKQMLCNEGNHKSGDDEFCCLGVLQNEIDGFWIQGLEHTYPDADDGAPFDSLLAKCFRKGKVPLDWDIEVTINGKRDTLITHNDDYGHTFKQIADAIEREL